MEPQNRQANAHLDVFHLKKTRNKSSSASIDLTFALEQPFDPTGEAIIWPSKGWQANAKMHLKDNWCDK